MNGMTDGTVGGAEAPPFRQAAAAIAQVLARHQPHHERLSGLQTAAAIRCSCNGWRRLPSFELDLELAHQLHQADQVAQTLADLWRLTPEVVAIKWGERRWWVQTRPMPTALLWDTEYWNELSRFAEACTPVGVQRAANGESGK